MDAKNALEAVEANIVAMRDTVPEAEQAEFDTGLVDLGLVTEAVGSLAVNTVDDRSEATTSDVDPETPIPIDLFSTLTPEQQERAKAKQVAFAEHFSTPERPLNPEDFGVVAVGEGKNRRTFVMLTTGNGLYKGSYNAIMSNDEDFTVEIDGEAIDTRTAMTWGIYRAFIDQAKADGNPLPDSAALAKENNEPHTATWLTGEKPRGLYARYGFVRGSVAYRRWYYQDYDWGFLRVRPGAEI